uniref:Uncharacterized protein n=1 Tax=Setaria viridis TaxID=4556 RepID=A0A4U6UJ76_SETVI|nr:hypothetical protein SEVIR_5G131250v2 [Setaria viridis]
MTVCQNTFFCEVFIWRLRFFCSLPEGEELGFEGLTEESEHTRWFLSMSAMLGAVRAHSLSVSHSSGHLFFPLLIEPFENKFL